jgi:hypothetical protein
MVLGKQNPVLRVRNLRFFEMVFRPTVHGIGDLIALVYLPVGVSDVDTWD